MKIIKKSQFISIIVLIIGLAFFLSQVYAQDLFYEYQSIPTHGATDWECFTIGADTFLAVANYYNDSTRDLESKIYKWNETLSEFVEVQSIPTHGALDWESFTIGSDTFLAVANRGNESTHNLESKIYKWNGSLSEFVEVQSIPTHGGLDWESFTIGADTFLAVANFDNESTYNIDSKIYKWNGTLSEFVEVQSIPTHGATDWESFTIDSDIFLAVANRRNDSTNNLESKIYKWNGSLSEFEEVQSIPTQGAFDWESFTIGSDTFLAVANRYNDSTYNIDSKIYKWNGSLSEFEEVQSIPTQGARDWESFTGDSDTFLAIANGQNDSTQSIDSKIYKWNGSLFVEAQIIPTHAALDWESFTIGSDIYLAVANYGNDSTSNIDSKIYKKKTTPFACAGDDQIVYDSVTLDGTASDDEDGGWIVSWEWDLIHQIDPINCNQTASGEIAIVNNLCPGYYNVTLTVTDDEGLFGTDDMLLAAIGSNGNDECQAALNVCSTNLGNCQDNLDICATTLTACQEQVALINNTMDNGFEELVNNFQNIFKDPDFNISGNNNLEKFNNLLNAIMNLNKGRKMGIYKNLGGK